MACEIGKQRKFINIEAKTVLSYLHSDLYHNLINILTDLTDQQLMYSAPQIDTRSIRDVAIHAYRPVLAIVCVLAGEEWPTRPPLPATKDELFELFQTMYVHIDEHIIHLSPGPLEEVIVLPWSQQQSGLEALVESFMHGMQHIGAIQGIRAFGGFPAPPEDAKPVRG